MEHRGPVISCKAHRNTPLTSHIHSRVLPPRGWRFYQGDSYPGPSQRASRKQGVHVLSPVLPHGGKEEEAGSWHGVSLSVNTVLFLLWMLWKPVEQWTWAAEKQWVPYSLSKSLWSCQETKIHPRSYCSSLYTEGAQRLAERSVRAAGIHPILEKELEPAP